MENATAVQDSPVTETITPEIKAAVETLITECVVRPEGTAPVIKVKKSKKVAVKKAAKKAVKKAVKVPVVKAAKVTKSKIDPKALVIPANAEMKIMGTCVKFTGKNGHGYLKGLRLEISNPIDSLKDRMDLITKAEAEKYHLGKSKAFIKVTNNDDLQAVLDLYFA